MNGRRYLEVELRDYLQDKLPGHMIPSSFVILDELPVSANGKVDRRMLPAPKLDRDGLPVSFVLPQTPTETALATIWSSILGIKKIGVHDNFFQLGGHSLSVTQVISRVQKMLEVELPFRKFFESPTIAELARWIDEVERSEEPLSLAQER
jgi:acyl carrier protein